MDTAFEKQTFGKRLKSMLKVDFKRAFTMPLVYIMAGICFAIPILILIMTAKLGGGGEEAMQSFESVWQTVGSLNGTSMSMDLTGMCNINMTYFLIAIFVCIFVAEDFKSGYAKNLFAVRSKKVDYVISKSAIGFVGGVIMIFAYFIGALIGGAIAGVSFDAGTVGAGGISACLLSKIFLIAVFASVAVLLGTVAKQKLWISIVGSLAAGLLLFMMIPVIAPLDAGFLNVIMGLMGGAAFYAGLGAVSCAVLNKTGLV